jgi:hypothetical protein
MGNSRSLIYVTSRAARTSRWMPWELGYFDGLKGSEQVSIMRLESVSHNKFVGEEYLGLYKQIERVRDGVELVPYAVRPSGKEGEPLTSFTHAAARFVNLVSQ